MVDAPRRALIQGVVHEARLNLGLGYLSLHVLCDNKAKWDPAYETTEPVVTCLYCQALLDYLAQHDMPITQYIEGDIAADEVLRKLGLRDG